MRIILITQDEPFYLAKHLKYLIQIFPSHSRIVGAIASDASPFGQKMNFAGKFKKTYTTFGLRFFLYYSAKFVKSKLDKSRCLDTVLSNNNIPKIILTESINHETSIETIKNYCPDLLVSILGNEIFKNGIINLAPRGCINLHTSLLPKYRGLMPTFWVMKNNEEFTGVSVFFVDKGIDSGPIIVQEKIKIGNQTHEALIKYTKRIGMEAIARAIDLVEKDQVKLLPNNAREKTYFSFPTREDVCDFLATGKKFF